MKTQFFNVLTIFAISVMTLSCNDKAKNAEAMEPEEVADIQKTGAKYMVNTADSKIEWKGFKPTGSLKGTVDIETGTFMTKDGNIETGSFLIDITSINSSDLEGDSKANLENHLKGTLEGKEDHFFNVTEYPTGAFEVTQSEKIENGKIMLSGNLELKGKKNNISIPVTMSESGVSITITSDAFTINRTKWGVNYGSKSIFDNLGDKFINDEIELKIMISANKA